MVDMEIISYSLAHGPPKDDENREGKSKKRSNSKMEYRVEQNKRTRDKLGEKSINGGSVLETSLQTYDAAQNPIQN
jgi:hypothetical protein